MLNQNEKAKYYCEIGIRQMVERRYKEAKESFRKAIRFAPGYAEAHFNLAVTLYILSGSRDDKKVIEEYEIAVKLNPYDAVAYESFDDSLRHLISVEHCRESANGSTYAYDHYNLGTFLHVLRNYEEAEIEYREAIRINKEYSLAHNNLGVLFYDLKRYDEAEKEFREAMRIDRHYEEPHYNLSLLLIRTGRIDEARKEILKSGRLLEGPTSTRIINALKTLSKKGETVTEKTEEDKKLWRLEGPRVILTNRESDELAETEGKGELIDEFIHQVSLGIRKEGVKSGRNYYLEYREIFARESDEEIIERFNKQVGQTYWGSARASLLAALHQEFEDRGFDYSEVGSKSGLSLARRVKLLGRKIKAI